MDFIFVRYNYSIFGFYLFNWRRLPVFIDFIYFGEHFRAGSDVDQFVPEGGTGQHCQLFIKGFLCYGKVLIVEVNDVYAAADFILFFDFGF